MIPARLHGFQKLRPLWAVEILLLEGNLSPSVVGNAETGERGSTGTSRFLDREQEPSKLHATVLEKNSEGNCLLQFEGVSDLTAVLETLGDPRYRPTLLGPPPEMTQRTGSVTRRFMPGTTAPWRRPPQASISLPELLGKLRQRGVETKFLTLRWTRNVCTGEGGADREPPDA